MSKPPETTPPLDVRIETDGTVAPGAAESARAKVTAALDAVRGLVLDARVRLTRTDCQATERPVNAQITVDVDGSRTRAHVSAATEAEAVDLVCHRLTRQLERLRRDRGARRGMPPGRPRGDAGHHDGRPANRPVPFPRPPHEREIVRHKSFALARETP
ncbi:MAG: HPF/RaiA family ribosome-associated protein, partial [Streptomycetaceae bacterium]|nr:HPF/RaiA family ribosome-associated protein [Streptomycetaceae bacterium]